MKKEKKAKYNFFSNQAGFLMTEAIFSIFILGIILVTFFTVLIHTFRTELVKRDFVVAGNLAQEGIEIVRNLRDNNWKLFPDAHIGFSITSPGLFVANGDYCVDYVNPPTSGTVCKLYLATSGDELNFYSHTTSGKETKFSRLVNIAPGSDDKERIVTSTVTWLNDGGTTQTVTVTDSLYAWGDSDEQ